MSDSGSSASLAAAALSVNEEGKHGHGPSHGHAAGRGHAPEFMDPSLFSDPHFSLEKGDIIIGTPPKCGTHFAMQIVYQMISGGDMSFESIYDKILWLEWKNFKGQTNPQRCQNIKDMPKAKNGMRIFKTHLGFPPLPFLSHVKYILVVRDTREMAVSFYHFLKGGNPDFAKYWNAPPSAKSLEQIVQDIELTPLVYPAIQSYWKGRQHPNVLLLSYTNLCNDLPKEVDKIAKFLNIELSDSERAIILKNSSFEEMRKHEIQFEPTKIGPVIDGKYVPVFLHQTGALVRQGKTDGGKSTLSAEQIKHLDEVDHEKLSEECIQFMRTGRMKEEEAANK